MCVRDFMNMGWVSIFRIFRRKPKFYSLVDVYINDNDTTLAHYAIVDPERIGKVFEKRPIC